MNNRRREFLKNLGTKSASVAVAVATPTAAYAKDFSSEVKVLSDKLKSEMTQKTAILGEQVSRIGQRVETIDMRMSYQQFQLHLIFLLLLISFLIDGGFSVIWLAH
ncbi:hypothetical protein [Solemya velum gill symbiont]|uniref:Uncharacterized protein n=1 Tax=Solemya velum gill symbiont TaxID=2340 RepID=A0A0B0H467_SOVGS|nr:hypothetical protein [Solemya velum gill symbiont]KHF25003.1 hypothetical protein JV46_09100 [Solemya velum gill symbiont]OOY34288.1 hypothetical protein BOV88_11005 [Solemya velum gill symbiont]OOY37061.1 hypothetical protein BOV89_09575 [Solemya velum gill symbiont]OOY40278.1 hypothetical protein BOV90_05085 [Solemya velum gill symbiont]OOY44769.1 hypothetical protein BOV91_00405 [Solemya velum gill symbiont]